MINNYPVTIKALALTVTLCCFSSLSASSPEETNKIDDDSVIFFVHGQYAPLIYSDVNGNSAGYFYELLQEVFSTRLGIEVKAQGLPWTRAQKLVKNGQADLLLTVPTEDRKSYMLSSVQSVFESKKRVYTYLNHPLYKQLNNANNIEELAILNLTTSNEYGNQWFKNNIESLGFKVIYVASEHSYMRMLAAKRFDVLFLDEISADGVIKNLGLESKILKLDVIASSSFSHILIRKQSKFSVLMPAVNNILDEMEKNGDLKRMLDKYQALDFIKTIKLRRPRPN